MPGIDDCKCILLIGGTSGIGQALAYALLDLPSKPIVIVGGRRQERLNEMKRERLEIVQVDISSDATQLKTFTDKTIQAYPDAWSSRPSNLLLLTFASVGRRSPPCRRHPTRLRFHSTGEG
jgi:NADP-dependent 3-hydroxy acid dehydrogenase YdfG